MKSSYLLFPHGFKKWGWIIFALSAILGIGHIHFGFSLPISFNPQHVDVFLARSFSDNNFTDEIAAIGIIAGLLIAGFSKVKVEDEYIQKLRLDSLLWATYVNYALIILTIIFIYGEDFLLVMMYNLFTFLIFFVIRFHIYLAKR